MQPESGSSTEAVAGISLNMPQAKRKAPEHLIEMPK